PTTGRRGTSRAHRTGAGATATWTRSSEFRGRHSKRSAPARSGTPAEVLLRAARTRATQRRGGREAVCQRGEMAQRPNCLLEGVHAQRGSTHRPGRLRGRTGADHAMTASANLDLVRSIYAAGNEGTLARLSGQTQTSS